MRHSFSHNARRIPAKVAIRWLPSFFAARNSANAWPCLTGARTKGTSVCCPFSPSQVRLARRSRDTIRSVSGSFFLLPIPSVSKTDVSRGSLSIRTAGLKVGQNRVELLTPSLSEKCSNRLSYWPNKKRMG